MRKQFAIFVLLILITATCVKNPTKEDLELNLTIKTDKQEYRIGESVTITFTNLCQSEVRLMEAMVQEKPSINYLKAPIFYLEINVVDYGVDKGATTFGTERSLGSGYISEKSKKEQKWIKTYVYSIKNGSQFPIHLQPNESIEYKSETLTSKFPDTELRITIEFMDPNNEYTFTAESPSFKVEALKKEQ